VVAHFTISYLERQRSAYEEMSKARLARPSPWSPGREDLLIGARRGSSLAVGSGDGTIYVCSATPFAFNAAVLRSSTE
jgi:glucosamine--fructose-6-phosphate aminotransferase (isomerizing)